MLYSTCQFVQLFASSQLTDGHAHAQSRLHLQYVSFRNLHSCSVVAASELLHLGPPEGRNLHQLGCFFYVRYDVTDLRLRILGTKSEVGYRRETSIGQSTALHSSAASQMGLRGSGGSDIMAS